MMSEGTKNIIKTMKARGIRKVIGCMSGTEEKTHLMHLTTVSFHFVTLKLCKSGTFDYLKGDNTS